MQGSKKQKKAAANKQTKISERLNRRTNEQGSKGARTHMRLIRFAVFDALPFCSHTFNSFLYYYCVHLSTDIVAWLRSMLIAAAAAAASFCLLLFVCVYLFVSAKFVQFTSSSPVE